MNPFQWLWTYLRKHKFYLILAFSLVIVFTLINLVPPYVSGVVVDRVILGRETELLWWLIVLIIAATMVKAATRYFYRWTFERISQDVVYNVRMNLYRKLQELDFAFFDRTRTGDLMTRMSGDAEAVRHFISWVAFSLVENIAIFLLSLAILFSINAQLTLALLVCTPVIGFLAFRLSVAVKPTFFAIREQLSRLNSVVQENISGNRVVKAFAREEYEIAKFDKENEGYK
ncbi:MAG: ABC transporter ATP-binding protein, partial [Firmicutes bacterium]|nr:ABC transporter ATP-binding protein [Bacillota bacterium]